MTTNRLLLFLFQQMFLNFKCFDYFVVIIKSIKQRISLA